MDALERENEWLREEKDNQDAMLQAVMHSVDKWFDKIPDSNPADRAADAREIALKAIESVEHELEQAKRYKAMWQHALREFPSLADHDAIRSLVDQPDKEERDE